MDTSLAGQRAARERLLSLGAFVDVRRGPGFVAVRSGLDSNDLNGVVADEGFVPSARLVADLVAWFEGAPAQWLAARPDPGLTRVLERAGLVPERTGWWCGRAVGTSTLQVEHVERVWSLGEWDTVAVACGWGRRPAQDLERRPHWVFRRDGRAVGMASGWMGEVCELVDLAVVPELRRCGIGTALVESMLAWAAGRGATHVVAAPSPDGWRLLSSLCFESARVTPDVTFYLPNG